jgi:hypothetical protein
MAIGCCAVGPLQHVSLPDWVRVKYAVIEEPYRCAEAGTNVPTLAYSRLDPKRDKVARSVRGG